MIILLGSVDLRTNSSPFRSTSKLSVRKVAAGFESFSRNHAEHAFSLSRISRTFSRARRIFCPGFPILAKSPCTRSLGARHPICSWLAGLHGFANGTLTRGVSQGEPGSPLAKVAAFESAAAPTASLMHGARPRGKLASGRGSAARRMNLAACGNATVAERLAMKRTATARMFLSAEYIFSPARTCNSPQTVPGGSLPDGRHTEARQGTVKPRSGTKRKDEVRGAKPPQTFME